MDFAVLCLGLRNLKLDASCILLSSHMLHVPTSKWGRRLAQSPDASCKKMAARCLESYTAFQIKQVSTRNFLATNQTCSGLHLLSAIASFWCFLDAPYSAIFSKHSASQEVKESRTFWNHGHCESHLSMLTSKIIQNHPKSPKCALLQELHNIHVVKPRISPRSDWATWSPPGLVTIPLGSSMASLEMVHQGLLCSRKMLHVKSWKTKTSDWKNTCILFN